MAVARHSLVVLSLFALSAFLLLVGLGVWQMQRLQWKEELLARIETRYQQPPVDIGEGLLRARQGDDVDYLAVEGEAVRVPGPELKLYWVDKGQPGWRLHAPYRLADGTGIIVDRGFVTDDVLLKLNLSSGPQHIAGRLRRAEQPGLFTPENDAAANEWYWRDLVAMSNVMGLDAQSLAPVYVGLESPVAESAWPRATVMPQDLPNRHLGYALTWFGLALCLAGVYGAYVFKSTRSSP